MQLATELPSHPLFVHMYPPVLDQWSWCLWFWDESKWVKATALATKACAWTPFAKLMWTSWICENHSGGWRLENPLAWPSFFKYFRQFKEKQRQGTFAILALRLYNCYNHAHVPGQHMWQSPDPRQGSKCSKTVEVRCSYSELKSCQREIATDKIQEKKNYWERSNIKSACVRALTGSVPHKMTYALQKDSSQYWNRTRVTRLSTTSLNHSTIGSCQLTEKNWIWIVILLEQFSTAFLGAELSISDSSVEYQG